MTLVPLGEASDPHRFGGKAAGLAEAIGAGHRVPMGVVLGVGALTPDIATLEAVLDRLRGSVAVRSSGVEEDGDSASFAGQYETILGVETAAELADAIELCRRSAAGEAAAQYGEHFHRDASQVAVLIQEMLSPDAAGVAFGVDPVTGADHVVIEAVSGLGDGLLAGSVDGDRWIVAPDARLDHGIGVIAPQAAADIAGLCATLAESHGAPVDIEWAVTDGAVHLLQVRPVTALPIEPSARPADGHTYVREPRFDRPLHPLSFSAWLPLHGRILGEMFAEFGMPGERLDNQLFLGRVYGRLVPLVGPDKDGPAPHSAILRLLLTLHPTMRRRLLHGRRWEGDTRIVELIEDWDGRLRAEDAERNRSLRTRDLGPLTDADLADHLDDVMAQVEATARHHFRLAFATQLIPTGRLGILLEEHLAWTPDQVIGLLQGHGQESTTHGRAVAELAARLGPDGVDRAIADPEWLLGRPAAEDYLAKHGHRLNVDLSLPTEFEDPALVADHLRRHRRATRAAVDPTEHASRLEAEAVDRLGDAQVATFHRLLELARRGRPYNDASEAVVLEALTIVRPIALEAGRRFAADRRLADPDDVFFLEVGEVLRLLRDAGLPAPDLTRRRGEFRWASANPAPAHLGPDPAPPPSWRAIPSSARSTVGAALWAIAALEAPATPQRHPSDGVLVGTPGSPGTATGTVCVVRSMADFPKVDAGDVVVCPTSVGAWSPIFGTIAAIVTEHGGPLSHPATLAREYGLPAVLGVAGATTSLQDGDRVVIDGATGTVEVL